MTDAPAAIETARRRLADVEGVLTLLCESDGWLFQPTTVADLIIVRGQLLVLIHKMERGEKIDPKWHAFLEGEGA